MTNPKVSVIMPVYNAEKYVQQAINSILSQSLTNFEFIIINDASSDKSEQLILSYHDERIVYVKNETNLKLATTLNKGIQLAQGQYIARMDADDIALSTRFERQVNWLDQHPKVGICGSFLQTFGKIETTWQYPTSDVEIKCNMLLHCPICHPSVMMRKSVIEAHHLKYNPVYEYCEDYELWIRASQVTQLYNIPENLMYYRLHDTQITASKKELYTKKVHQLRAMQLEKLTLTPTTTYLQILEKLAHEKYPDTPQDLLQVEELLTSLKSMNQKLLIYDRPTFNEFLFWRCWFPMVCFFQKSTKNNIFLAQFLVSSPFSKYYFVSRLQKHIIRTKHEN